MTDKISRLYIRHQYLSLLVVFIATVALGWYNRHLDQIISGTAGTAAPGSPAKQKQVLGAQQAVVTPTATPTATPSITAPTATPATVSPQPSPTTVKQTNTPANPASASPTAIVTLPSPTLTPPSPTPISSPTPQTPKVGIGHLPIKGDASAKVTLVEFSDFQCPYCKNFFANTLGQIEANYINSGKVRFAYRHLPLSTIHPNAQKAAEASECANEQGKFWELHNVLFQNQADWAGQSSTDAVNTFAGYAQALGINQEQFINCLSSGKYKSAVDEDVSAARSLNVNGTPGFFLNDTYLPGAQPYENFRSLIEQELAKG